MNSVHTPSATDAELPAAAEAQAQSLLQPRSRGAALKGVDHYDISVRACQIWEAEGCPEGRDLEHWLRAERELLEER